MTAPFYTDDWLTLYGGDCRAVLAGLPADSVDCVVTSPPYWGLRDYGTATWSGGDAECDHKIGRLMGNANKGHVREVLDGNREVCKCGATRIDSQLGLERTPEEYVANMVAVFREVRRVLKPSGTCWLNLGDSYAGSWGAQSRGGPPSESSTLRGNGHVGGGPKAKSLSGVQIAAAPKGTHTGSWVNGRSDLKPKDLVGIPWRVAFALQADGWYLRSDIIWSKPNPMPESVTDRPTKSHEYLFLLTKSARYYFDADAVREAYSEKTWFYDHVEPTKYARANGGVGNGGPTSTLGVEAANRHGGRNIRSVWTIATRPYPGAHFAVFPPELPERCIKAGSSEKGVCPECGAPWERVVERERLAPAAPSGMREVGRWSDKQESNVGGRTRSETTGWRPMCAHFCKLDERGGCIDARPCYHKPLMPDSVDTDPKPAVILDPFGGSGTVGMVANRLSRRAILIDLNPEYLEQQMRRNAQTPLGLTEGDAA
jgi:DNA modification methylase